MILTFQGRNRNCFPYEAQQMFRLRAEFFAARFGWDVTVENGLEKDEFDEMDPLYVLSVDGGSVLGALRLLPTTGPTSLSGGDVAQFGESGKIAGPDVVQCSKFAVDQTFRRRTPAGVSIVTAELLMASCDILIQTGVRRMAGIFDARMISVYRRAGWAPTVVARSEVTPNVMLGMWSVQEAVRGRLVHRHGFAHALLRRPGNSFDIQRFRHFGGADKCYAAPKPRKLRAVVRSNRANVLVAGAPFVW